jgi:large subunit ribosomal protein L30
MLEESLLIEEFHLRKFLTHKTIEMARIKVTKVKSAINRTQRQKRVLESLGLKKIGQVVEHEATSSILGMVNKVNHLVSVEEIK